MLNMSKARKIYIDVLRILGAFMVLYIHCRAYHEWEKEAMPLAKRIVFMLPAMIVSSAVPLFMMISGCLLLGRCDSLKDIWEKRISKVALVILIFTVLQCIYEIIFGGSHFTTFIYKLINLDGKYYLYWFFYWWLSFSIMLFCYQQIAKVLDKEHITYILGICLFFNTLVPLINLFLAKYGIEPLIFSRSLNLPLFVSQGFFYPFLGYYIGNRSEDSKLLNNTKLIILIMIFCIIATMFLNFYFKIDEANMPARNVFLPVITICIFAIIKNIFSNIDIKPDTKLYKTITFFGSNAIGVYAFQVLYLSTLGPAILNFLLRFISIKKLASFIQFLLAFFVLSFITAVARKIPLFKKALG